MAVVASMIIADRAQRDGRRYITERHERADGTVVLVEYLVDAVADASATMLARVPFLDAQEVEAERRGRLRRLREVVLAKRDDWLRGQTDLALKTTLLLTDAQLRMLKVALGTVDEDTIP